MTDKKGKSKMEETKKIMKLTKEEPGNTDLLGSKQNMRPEENE